MSKKSSSKTTRQVPQTPAIPSWEMPKKTSSKPLKPVPQSPAVPSWEMPKKTSSKPPKPVPQKPAVAKEKPSKAFGQEIEEIFSKKRKKGELEKSRKASKLDEIDRKENGAAMKPKKKSKSGGSNVDMFEKEETARPKRKTADGLAIYSEEELGIGKSDAGGINFGSRTKPIKPVKGILTICQQLLSIASCHYISPFSPSLSPNYCNFFMQTSHQTSILFSSEPINLVAGSFFSFYRCS